MLCKIQCQENKTNHRLGENVEKDTCDKGLLIQNTQKSFYLNNKDIQM